MKVRLFTTIILLAGFSACYGQQSSPWTKWTWLMGEWKGEGAGNPGQGSGVFSFKTDLSDHILVRKSHSEYPASGNKPATIHDDLMIVSLDFGGNPSRAIYFDNEGHTINYTISYTDNSIILISDKIEHVPTFRLTYTNLGNNTVNTKFEMSQDGIKFFTYIEGKSLKTE